MKILNFFSLYTQFIGHNYSEYKLHFWGNLICMKRFGGARMCLKKN